VDDRLILSRFQIKHVAQTCAAVLQKRHAETRSGSMEANLEDRDAR